MVSFCDDLSSDANGCHWKGIDTFFTEYKILLRIQLELHFGVPLPPLCRHRACSSAALRLAPQRDSHTLQFNFRSNTFQIVFVHFAPVNTPLGSVLKLTDLTASARMGVSLPANTPPSCPFT